MCNYGEDETCSRKHEKNDRQKHPATPTEKLVATVKAKSKTMVKQHREKLQAKEIFTFAFKTTQAKINQMCVIGFLKLIGIRLTAYSRCPVQ